MKKTRKDHEDSRIPAWGVGPKEKASRVPALVIRDGRFFLYLRSRGEVPGRGPAVSARARARRVRIADTE